MQYEHFEKGGGEGLQMRRLQNSDFLKLMVCPHGQSVRGEWVSAWTFFGQGGGRYIFRDFMRTSFMVGPYKITIGFSSVYCATRRL